MIDRFRSWMLLAACLLAAGAEAQTWTASEAAAGTFYLYNVGNDGFLVGGNNWSTRASLTSQGGIPVTLQAGSADGEFYISTSPTYNGLFLGHDGYVDVKTTGNYTAWKFIPVDGQANTYQLQAKANSKYLYGQDTDLTKTTASTTLPAALEKSYWRLATREALLDNFKNASAEHPVDATFLILNPYFGRVAAVSGLWQGTSVTHKGYESGDSQNYCVEAWNKTFDSYQVLTGLPSGSYQLTVQGFYRMGGGANDAATAGAARAAGTEALNAKYYLNEVEAPLKSIFDSELTKAYNSAYNTSTAVSINGTNYYVPNNQSRAGRAIMLGQYQNEPIQAVVTDGTLRLGVRKSVASSQDWTVWDNFVLTYCGADLSVLVDAYESQLAAARALQGQPMQATVAAALDEAVAAATTDVDTSSEAWLETTVGLLSNAITAAQTSTSLYASAILPAVEGMKLQSTSDDVRAALDRRAADGLFDSAADVYAAYQALELATLSPAEGADYTSAIINPGFELGNTDGWTCQFTGSDTGVHHTYSETYLYDGTEGDYLFNTWVNRVTTLDLSQTVEGLPAGYYTLSAVVAGYGDASPITLKANNKTATVSPVNDDVDAEAHVGHELKVSGVLVYDGRLSVTLTNTGKGNTFFKADAFRLTFESAYQPLESYENLRLTASIENDQVAAYLATSPYGKAEASVISNYDLAAIARNDQPAPVVIPLPAQETEATLSVSLSDDFSGALTQTVGAGSIQAEVFNLLPRQTYYYKVEAGGDVVASGTVQTEGRLRMIRAEGIANMRDLGGWATADGGRLRYGLIYRGSELRGGKSYTATDADLAMLAGLGIGAEVDLREDVDFADGLLGASAIEGAGYYYANLSRWSEDALNFDTAKFKAGFDLVLAALRRGDAAYFHCIFGADRTGCFAFLLEGLLGLPVEALYKDYELTSFSSAGIRAKDGIDHKIQYISALQGETLQEKFFNYWRGAVGVSEADLREFIGLMVEGEHPITGQTLADLPAPAVADGEYYLYIPAGQRFVGRGRNYGTQGVPDRYGVPASVKTNGAGVTTVQFLDNGLFLGSDGFADKAMYYNTVSWFVEQEAGHFILRSHNGAYLNLLDDADGARLRAEASTPAEAVALDFLTKEEQQAIVAEASLQNVLAAAEAAGIVAEDIADLEAQLDEDYTTVSGAVTIQAAKAGSTTAWVLSEPFARNETANYGNAYNVGSYGGELYQKNASVSQRVKVSHPGLYRLTLNALYRQGSNADCYAIGQKGYELSTAYVSINGEYFAQIPSWYSDAAGAANPDNTSQAQALMDAGKYAVTLYAYIGEDLTADISINVPNFTPRSWCLFNNFKLTEFARNVVISEDAGEAPEAIPYAAVTLQRTLGAETWNTFCVPFDLSYTQLLSSSLRGATFYAFDSSDATTLNLKRTTALKAGVPYLVKPAAEVVNPSFTGVRVEASEGQTAGEAGSVQFVGQVYARPLDGEADVCYLSTDGRVKLLGEGAAIKGLRAYFIVPEAAENVGSVKVLVGGTTAVESLPAAAPAAAAQTVYDLGGRRMSGKTMPSKAGVYISGGKKMIVH